MGCTMRSKLRSILAPHSTKPAILSAHLHQRTGIAGLCAAGDIVDDKAGQIAVAFGHAGDRRRRHPQLSCHDRLKTRPACTPKTGAVDATSYHRVKNTLATVQSLAMQTARHSDSLQDLAERYEKRLLGLARAHDLLTRRHWEDAPLDFLARSIAPIGRPGSTGEN